MQSSKHMHMLLASAVSGCFRTMVQTRAQCCCSVSCSIHLFNAQLDSLPNCTTWCSTEYGRPHPAAPSIFVQCVVHSPAVTLLLVCSPNARGCCRRLLTSGCTCAIYRCFFCCAATAGLVPRVSGEPVLQSQPCPQFHPVNYAGSSAT